MGTYKNKRGRPNPFAGALEGTGGTARVNKMVENMMERSARKERRRKAATQTKERRKREAADKGPRMGSGEFRVQRNMRNLMDEYRKEHPSTRDRKRLEQNI